MIPHSYQMRFEFRHLRSFMVIAEELSFRKAAENLHIAQPALSKQIAQLEQALGCELFDRQKRRIKLTAAGAFLYERLPLILDQLHETTQQTKKVASGLTAILKFGYSSAAMSNFLPSVIEELQHQLEGCEFSFVEATSDKLIGDVIAERLDAAFILHRPDIPLLNMIPIKAEQAGIILTDDHPLARRKRVALEELSNETLILFPRSLNPVMYDDIISHCHKAGFSPKAIIETAPRSTAIGLVAARQGIATIAESLKHTCVKGTIFRPLKQPAPMVNYSCITRAGRTGRWLDILHRFIQQNLAQS